MLKIHTSDGQTTRLDLSDEEQAKEWLERLKNRNFQATIRGISVVQECEGRFKCPNCKRTAKLVCASCGHSEHGVTCGSGVQYSLSRPADFGDVFYLVENVKPDKDLRIRGGEKVTCFTDNIRICLMVHRMQKASRVTVMKTGKHRFNPFAT
jgi:hypothetical protein